MDSSIANIFPGTQNSVNVFCMDATISSTMCVLEIVLPTLSSAGSVITSSGRVFLKIKKLLQLQESAIRETTAELQTRGIE